MCSYKLLSLCSKFPRDIHFITENSLSYLTVLVLVCVSGIDNTNISLAHFVNSIQDGSLCIRTFQLFDLHF